MEIFEALIAELNGSSDVTDLVGTRIYSAMVPQDKSQPCIGVARVGTPNRNTAHDGPTGLVTGRFQISCQAKYRADASSVAKVVRQLLDGFRGMLGGSSGVEVFRAAVTNDYDDFAYNPDLYLIRFDVRIFYREET